MSVCYYGLCTLIILSGIYYLLQTQILINLRTKILANEIVNLNCLTNLLDIRYLALISQSYIYSNRLVHPITLPNRRYNLQEFGCNDQRKRKEEEKGKKVKPCTVLILLLYDVKEEIERKRPIELSTYILAHQYRKSF